jgi:tetratricopeptide (TPR) repeat protein
MALGCSPAGEADSVARRQLREAERYCSEGDTAAALEILGSVRCADTREQVDLHCLRLRCCLRQAAGEQKPAARGSLLASAQAEMDRVRVIADRTSDAAVAGHVSDRYADMLRRLSEAYRQATKLAVSQGRTNVAKEFCAKRAELLASVAGHPRFRTLEDLLEIAVALRQAGQYERAVEVYRSLLAAFDRDGNRVGVADKAVGGAEDFKRGLAGDPDRVRMGREYLDEFGLYVNGRDAVVKGGKLIAPAMPRDYPRALRNLDLFMQAYPGYDLTRSGKPGRLRRRLEAVRKELELRMALQSAVNGITASLLDRGEQLRRDHRKKELAGVLQRAVANARSAADHWPDHPGTCCSLGRCLLALGGQEELREARSRFDKLLQTTPAGGPWHYEALKGAVAARRALGDEAGGIGDTPHCVGGALGSIGDTPLSALSTPSPLRLYARCVGAPYLLPGALPMGAEPTGSLPGPTGDTPGTGDTPR